MIASANHSFIQNIYWVSFSEPGTVLGIIDIVVNKTVKNNFHNAVYILVARNRS